MSMVAKSEELCSVYGSLVLYPVISCKPLKRRNRYSRVQKGPVFPNFCNAKNNSDAYSFTRER
jgi:hypothetical protein